jgi:hypothetical protein
MAGSRARILAKIVAVTGAIFIGVAAPGFGATASFADDGSSQTPPPPPPPTTNGHPWTG